MPAVKHHNVKVAPITGDVLVGIEKHKDRVTLGRQGGKVMADSQFGLTDTNFFTVSRLAKTAAPVFNPLPSCTANLRLPDREPQPWNMLLLRKHRNLSTANEEKTEESHLKPQTPVAYMQTSIAQRFRNKRRDQLSHAIELEYTKPQEPLVMLRFQTATPRLNRGAPKFLKVDPSAVVGSVLPKEPKYERISVPARVSEHSKPIDDDSNEASPYRASYPVKFHTARD